MTPEKYRINFNNVYVTETVIVHIHSLIPTGVHPCPWLTWTSNLVYLFTASVFRECLEHVCLPSPNRGFLVHTSLRFSSVGELLDHDIGLHKTHHSGSPLLGPSITFSKSYIFNILTYLFIGPVVRVQLPLY